MPEKLKGVCRLCLSKEGFMFPIFRKDDKSETSFRTKILTCASIEIFADDDLPSEICHICAHQVEKSYQFRTICENVDAALRSQLNECENEIIEQTISGNTIELSNAELHNEWPTKNSLCKDESILCFSESKMCDTEDNNSGVYVCFACSSAFMVYNQLLDHLIKTHPDITLFPCSACKLHFSQINEYRVHLNLKHALSCNKCDFVFKHPKNLELHLKSHTVDVLTCQYCKKTFEKHLELKKHELSHLEKMCKFCCKVFATDEEYSEHMKDCNEIYCKFCNQVFHQKKDLIDHVNSCHENSSALKCKSCSQIFGKWVELQNHTCKVQTEKNTCKYCQQTFSESSLLESHISSEHNEELLVCKFCTKSFTLKSALRRHEKSHSGLKPYQCKYCLRKFKDNSTCIVHIRTHTGEHPFQCQECHKDFKQLANLKMHTYRHHKVNNKSSDNKTEMLKEAEQIYDQLYTTSVIDNYSPEVAKPFQTIDSAISSGFSESNNVLLTEHH